MANKKYEKQITERQESVKITREALEKGNYIAKRVCELSHGYGLGSLEIFLYNLNDIDKQEQRDIAIRDLYIPPKQKVTSVACDLEGESSYYSRNDAKINLKRKIIGWSHSHGDLDSFVSGKDRYNSGWVVRFQGIEGSLKHEVESCKIETADIEKGKITLDGKEFNLQTEDKELVKLFLAYHPIKITKVEDKKYNWMPSLIFNSHSKPAPFFTYHIDKETHIIENYPIEVIEENNGIEMDPMIIDYQIITRLDQFRPALNEILQIESNTLKKSGLKVKELNLNYKALKGIISNHQPFSTKIMTEQESKLVQNLVKDINELEESLHHYQKNPFAEIELREQLDSVRKNYQQAREDIVKDFRLIKRRISNSNNKRVPITQIAKKKFLKKDYQQLLSLLEKEQGEIK